MVNVWHRVKGVPQLGLIGVILTLCTMISLRAGSHVERMSGQTINSFLNPATQFQVLTDTSFLAVMAVGITFVILTGGIDLSVGSTYALAGVLTALMMRGLGASAWAPGPAFLFALSSCLAIGVLAGLFNGLLVVHLGVHPFVITLGTMWVYRGIAFVASKAESILVPQTVTGVVKANLGFRMDLYPLPMITMLIVVILASVYLSKSVAGRNTYAVGGNVEASHFAGLDVPRVLISAYSLCGLAAGFAAFLGAGFYGAASCSDGQGYELYAIAAAVVGGVSLAGGRGTALGAALGTLLIVLFRQGVVTLHLESQYEWIVIGLAIIVAVYIERRTRASEGKAS